VAPFGPNPKSQLEGGGLSLLIATAFHSMFIRFWRSQHPVEKSAKSAPVGTFMTEDDATETFPRAKSKGLGAKTQKGNSAERGFISPPSPIDICMNNWGGWQKALL